MIQIQAHNYQVNASSNPWPHFEFSDFLTPESFHQVQHRLLNYQDGFECQADDPEAIHFAPLPDLELAQFMLSGEFRSFVEGKINQRLRIVENSAIQLRRMTEDSPEFPPHVDFIDELSLITLFYISPYWDSEKGGELVLLPDEKTDPSAESCKWISPKANKLVMFFSNSPHWHMVRKTKNWQRYMVMAEWYLSPKDKVHHA